MACEYPYQETDIYHLYGEEWRDVESAPCYQVSNFGRVRSIDRVVLHPRLKKQFVKGRILKQSISYNKNTICKDKRVDLRVSLNVEGRPQYHNVRRLVYSAFVEKIDFQKDGMYVINKDGNGFNNRVHNLALITKSEKAARAFRENRVPESYLKTADRSIWTKPYGGFARRKSVIQLKDGFEVKRYASIKEASRQTGIGEKEIIGVAKGRFKSWNGFVFKYIE